jgi:hypothetical protein
MAAAMAASILGDAQDLDSGRRVHKIVVPCGHRQPHENPVNALGAVGGVKPSEELPGHRIVRRESERAQPRVTVRRHEVGEIREGQRERSSVVDNPNEPPSLGHEEAGVPWTRLNIDGLDEASGRLDDALKGNGLLHGRGNCNGASSKANKHDD